MNASCLGCYIYGYTQRHKQSLKIVAKMANHDSYKFDHNYMLRSIAFNAYWK